MVWKTIRFFAGFKQSLEISCVVYLPEKHVNHLPFYLCVLHTAGPTVKLDMTMRLSPACHLEVGCNTQPLEWTTNNKRVCSSNVGKLSRAGKINVEDFLKIHVVNSYLVGSDRYFLRLDRYERELIKTQKLHEKSTNLARCRS